MKDDSGSFAVFAEQGSSASQKTAAKVMDIISRLPGCAGQAADAVSACTQVKMEDAPTLLKNSRSQSVQIFGYVYRRHKWPKSWSSMERPRRSSRKESVWSSFGRTTVGTAILRKFFLQYGWEKSSKLGMFIRQTEKKGLFLSVCVDENPYWHGKRQNIRPIWKILMKDVDVGEPTSFLDHVYFGALQRKCQIS